MALYKYNTSGVFSEIKEKPFKLERDIQRMFETNMSEIMGLEMIKSEFTIKDRRIDTLAFDHRNNDKQNAERCSCLTGKYGSLIQFRNHTVS